MEKEWIDFILVWLFAMLIGTGISLIVKRFIFYKHQVKLQVRWFILYIGFQYAMFLIPT